MWNYSNVKPLEEIYSRLTQVSTYIQKQEITDEYNYTVFAVGDEPRRIILWCKKYHKITIKDIEWVTTNSGKKYFKVEKKVYKYGMCFNYQSKKYEFLPEWCYINNYDIHFTFSPKYERLSKEEKIELLKEEYGKKLISKLINMPFDGMMFLKILRNLDKSNLTKVQQFVAKNNTFNHLSLVTLRKVESTWIIRDYINMCDTLKKKIVVGLSERRYKELHDELVIELNNKNLKRKRNRKLIINKNLVINHPEYELITDTKRLWEEGMNQHHCVGNYHHLINKGKCVIYSTVQQGERWTIEYNGRINQMKGKYNKYVPEPLLAKVHSDFKLFI